MKKTTSRIITFLLIAILSMSLFSCDLDIPGLDVIKDTDTPKTVAEKYAAWAEALRSAESVKIVGNNITTQMDVGTGEKLLVVNTIFTDEREGQKHHVTINESYNENAVISELWYVDGFVYSKGSSSQQKIEMTYEDYVASTVKMEKTFDPSLTEFPAAWLDGTEITKNESGIDSVSVSVNAEQYKAAFPKGAYVSALEMKAAEATLVYELLFDNDGKMTKITASLSAIQGESTITMSSSIELSGIGSTTVTLPEGAEDWQVPVGGGDDENGSLGEDNSESLGKDDLGN